MRLSGLTVIFFPLATLQWSQGLRINFVPRQIFPSSFDYENSVLDAAQKEKEIQLYFFTVQ